jgi:hypothetical protein
LICLELLGFELTKVLPDLFDQRQQVLTTLRPNALDDFKQSVASNILGWDTPAGDIRRLRNCVGAGASVLSMSATTSTGAASFAAAIPRPTAMA